MFIPFSLKMHYTMIVLFVNSWLLDEKPFAPKNCHRIGKETKKLNRWRRKSENPESPLVKLAKNAKQRNTNALKTENVETGKKTMLNIRSRRLKTRT